MFRIRSLAGALVLGISVLVTGCTDSPTAPETQTPVEAPSYDLSAAERFSADLGIVGGQVTVVERSVPLRRDEVVTRRVGRWGGIIRLRRSGLTVFIPFGALSEPTEITVTAPAGDLLGYHFAPHGLEFRRPVTVVQNMTVAELLSRRNLTAAYFEGELEPEVTALESLTLWLLRTLGIFRIEHFSGYVIATT